MAQNGLAVATRRLRGKADMADLREHVLASFITHAAFPSPSDPPVQNHHAVPKLTCRRPFIFPSLLSAKHNISSPPQCRPASPQHRPLPPSSSPTSPPLLTPTPHPPPISLSPYPALPKPPPKTLPPPYPSKSLHKHPHHHPIPPPPLHPPHHPHPPTNPPPPPPPPPPQHPLNTSPN